MDTRLSGYGWSGSADCSITELHEVLFDTGGVLYSANTFRTNKKKVSVSAEFKYNNLDIGLVLWYNNESGHMQFVVNQNMLYVERVIRGIPTIISQIPFDTLTPPATNDVVTLEAELSGTNLKCYYNSTEVFNIEQSLFRQGYFGVYGSTAEKCTSFTLKSNKIGDWNKYIADSTSIDKDGDNVKIEHSNPALPFVYIYQDVTTTESGSYTISFDYIGSVRADIMNGGTEVASSSFEYTETKKRASITFVANGLPFVTVRIGSNVQGMHFISFPQMEFKSFDTSYVNGARLRSSLSFPAAKVNKEYGALALDIKPLHSYATGELPIFFYGSGIGLVYEAGKFEFTYGSQSVTVDKIIEEGKCYYISCTWENTNSIYLDVLDDQDVHTENTLSIPSQTIAEASVLYVGCSDSAASNMVIDNLVVYRNHTDLETLVAHRTNEELSDDNVVIKSNFNKNTFVYDKNRVAIPAPKPDSPIIIETESQDLYTRVYFVDSGVYVTYNLEMYEYKDSKVFKMSYGDILKAEVFTYDMDKMLKDLTIADDIITVNDLTDDDKGKKLVFKYTIRNTFAVNYNSEYNQFEIEFSNTDGEPITVYCDNAEGTDTKLVTPIQLNPFKSTNNSGFIFVEDNPRELETFDIKATPDSLIADGYDTATITIDCISEGGIPTSNVDLEIQSISNYGTVIKYITPYEKQWFDYASLNGEDAAVEHYGYLITDEHRAGRFIYKYKAGKFGYQEGQYEMTDYVIVRDKISGIGTQIPIRLVRES